MQIINVVIKFSFYLVKVEVAINETFFVYLFDFVQGEVKCRLSDGNRPVPELLWMDGRVGENNGHLLLALHLPSTLILWDTGSGQQVQIESVIIFV